MNLPKNRLFFERTWKIKSLYMPIPVLLFFFGLAGCGDNVHLPTPQELVEFENASPLPPSIDMDRIVKAKIGGGPYHVIAGDALELTMPAVERFITAKEMGNTTTVTPYIARVNTNGNITLPIVGDIEAAGRTLPQIESDIIDAYYPKHVVTRPSVYARVLDYHTFKVSITGAVTTPGIYSLRSDQMSLVALIMEAGGIIDEGAALIRIVHGEEAVSNEENAVIKAAKRTFYQPGGQSIVSPVESAADQIITNQNDIPPFFRHAYSSSAIGALATRQSDKRLLTCYGNTADNSQRPILVDRLTLNEPQVSKDNNDEELFSPAKPVEYRYSESNLINTAAVANSNLESNTHNSSLKAKSDGAYGQDFTQTSASNSNFRSQRITQTSGSPKSTSIVLPVKGYNIPFTDVALQEGDSVVVERLEPPLFTVIDLVNRPGNFPYPPDVQYTLMQAIGFAGGLNPVTEPRYATIYRLKRDGTCISATFPLNGKSKLANASNTLIKPGDIIAVEHTPRTRTALFLDRTFRISIGTYWRLNNNNDF
jgi:polysaccharide export outer membrane protein